MKLLLRAAVVGASVGAAILFVHLETAGRATTDEPEFVHATVASTPAVSDIRRAGVNLGSWTSWGAEQLSSNVLKNPSFDRLAGVFDRRLGAAR